MPLYDGIQRLRAKGDAIQWGGQRLCEGGAFPTADGRARFTPLRPPEAVIPEGQFLMSTRRGKQFNSMVQSERDPLTGARREDVLMNAEDAAELNLSDGDDVLVTSEADSLRARCKFMPMKRRNIQVHWPEANVLIKRGATDPVCGIPDYNATVGIVPLPSGDGTETDEAHEER